MHDGVCSSGLSITWLTSGTQTVITLNTAYEETFLFYTTDERDTADCLCLSKTLIWLTMNVFDFCFVSLSTFSRQCVKEWHSGPIPRKFSFDECRMAPSGCRPKTKPDDLGCESACTGCQNLHPPSPFIIITQPKSWYFVQAARIYTHHRHLLLLLSPKADTHFTVPRRVEGWVDLACWLHTEMVYLSTDGHLSEY